MGLIIITVVALEWIPITFIFTIPFIILAVYKMGKDVDDIVDEIILLDVLRFFDMMDEETKDNGYK